MGDFVEQVKRRLALGFITGLALGAGLFFAFAIFSKAHAESCESPCTLTVTVSANVISTGEIKTNADGTRTCFDGYEFKPCSEMPEYFESPMTEEELALAESSFSEPTVYGMTETERRATIEAMAARVGMESPYK